MIPNKTEMLFIVRRARGIYLPGTLALLRKIRTYICDGGKYEKSDRSWAYLPGYNS